MYHMSRVMRHMSRVTCHFFFFFFFFLDKVVKLIGGGSVINGAYPVKFTYAGPMSTLVEPNQMTRAILIHQLQHGEGSFCL